MKPSLAPGLTFARRITVDAGRTIGFMGEEGRVYATPSLVNDVEYACRDGILPHLDEGEDSVGVRVELDHLAPTLPGMQVEITVTVVAVDKRRVTFEAAARDPVEEIGRGRHVRFVVDVARTRERLKAKAGWLSG